MMQSLSARQQKHSGGKSKRDRKKERLTLAKHREGGESEKVL